jgi:hypothetical protein
MTAASQHILESFDQLPENEKKEVALEIIRRTSHFDLPDLTDEDLVQNAENLFLALDLTEAQNE